MATGGGAAARTARVGARSVAISFATLSLSYGVWYGYSVFLVALLGEFGWPRSLVAGAFSLFTLTHGLASFPIGWLADRIGVRRVVLAGGALLGLGLLLDSLVTRPWHLYLAFGVVTALGVAAAGWVPAVILVQRWFPRRVGTVLGLTSAGTGLGIVLMPPFCQWLIESLGWRAAFRIVATIAVLWILPSTARLVRDPPRPAASPRAADRAGADVTLGHAVLTGRFWLLSLAQLTASFVNQMLLVHQVAFLVDHGIPALRAATVVAVVGVGSILAKVAGGWTSDSLGREATYMAGNGFVVASIGALGLLAVTHAMPWAWAYGALVGVGYAVTTPLMPAVIADVYRGRNFGAILGAIGISNALGGSGGPWVAGLLYDTTGSYAISFAAGAVSAMLSATALWIAAPRRGPEAG